MRKLLAGIALAAAFAVPHLAHAQDDSPNTGGLTFSGGVDYVTAYFVRGYELADRGLIVQPFAQVAVKAYESTDFNITPYIGTWNSFHEYAAPGDSQWWEADVYGGVDFGTGPLTIAALYTFYTYPGDAAGTIEELGVKLSYDDAAEAEGMGLPFQLRPYIGWYKETTNQNTWQGQYLEVGINPGFDLTGTPIGLSFPIAVGLSPDGYYIESNGSNEFFGFTSVGAYANYALPFGTYYGSWSLYGGVTWYYLNAHSARYVGGESRTSEAAAKIGVSFVY